MYEYEVTILRVIDADTIDVSIDLGFDIHVKKRIRVLGIDAPERNTDEGKEATQFVQDYVQIGMKFPARTEKNKNDKYGRWLADINIHGTPLSETLIQKGLAKPYNP